jgi:glycine cleavage system aminomethyltransferase T
MTPDSHALPIVPQIPVPDDVHAYLRFGAEFEPYEYTGWIDESMSWKETCYIGDWSPLFKMHLQGPDALAFFASLAGNDFDRFAIGQAKHLALPNARGKVMGDGILMRRGEDEFLFTSGPGALWTQWKFGRGGYDAVATDLTRDQFIFQVQGPASLQVLEQATQQSFRDIEFMRFAERDIDGMRFDVLRQGMAGEVGYELHGRTEDGIAIWNRILEVGAAHGIRRLGGRTKMVNHVEACFPTPSVDYQPAWFDDEIKDFADHAAADVARLSNFFWRHRGSYVTEDVRDYFYSPVDLGWGRVIKFDHEFVGREALEREVAEPRRKMVTLVWNHEDVLDVHASLHRDGPAYQYMEMPRNGLGCMWADRVEKDGELVGITTSRCHSYFFRQTISLCPIDPAVAEPGTEVEVVWGEPDHPQKRIRATVARAPYKTDRRRADLAALPAQPPTGA